MKKLLLTAGLSFLFVLITNLGNAQIPENKTEKINRNEVPVSVQKSLKENFSISPNDGNWSVNYSLYGFGGERPTVEVNSYTFAQKKDGEKIRISFDSKGEIESTHNIERNSARGDTSE